MDKRRAEPAERERWYDCRLDDSATGGRSLRDLTVEGCVQAPLPRAVPSGLQARGNLVSTWCALHVPDKAP